MNLKNNLFQKYNDYLLGAFLVALGFGLFFGLGVTNFLAWQKSKADLVTSTSELNNMKSLQAEIRHLNSIANSLNQQKSQVNSVLSGESSVPVVMTQVQQIAAENGVTVGALQFSGIKEGVANSVGLQVAVTGPFESVQNFLKRVETSGRLLTVNSLSFTASGQTLEPGVKTVTLTLGISSPYLPPSSSSDNPNLGFLISSEYQNLINTLATWRIYSSVVDTGVLGKPNPFE